MTIPELLSTLLEARRYAVRAPQHTAKLIRDAAKHITIWGDAKVWTSDFWYRMKWNLEAALEFTLVDPEMVQGALYAAYAEIQALHKKQELEKNRQLLPGLKPRSL